MTNEFVVLAFVTRLNIISSPYGHLRPVEVSLYQFHGFIDTKVAGDLGVMFILQDYPLQQLVFWYRQAFFPEQQGVLYRVRSEVFILFFSDYLG